MLTCEKCSEKKPNVADLIINGKPMRICADCARKMKIHSLGYSIKRNCTATDKPITQTKLYFRITNPEYFGNADKICVGYTFCDLERSERYWQDRARIDIIAPLLHLERDNECKYIETIVKYLTDETSERNEEACKYFDCLVPITKEEFGEEAQN